SYAAKRAGMGATVWRRSGCRKLNLDPSFATRNWKRIEAAVFNPEKENVVAATTKPQMAA
ncbi:hypothetical protein V2H26_21975, partial [Xanthomonas euvesicatoria]|uniref:hypothetical protein n=1 Tax=Xanthomonas citri TaxID=346 RepID=UPI002ED75863|nr:hypothetical protein [Xanthomonas euvesicatoria]